MHLISYSPPTTGARLGMVWVRAGLHCYMFISLTHTPPNLPYTRGGTGEIIFSFSPPHRGGVRGGTGEGRNYIL